MVTTSTSSSGPTATTTNNGNMLVYNNSNSTTPTVSNNTSGLTSCSTTVTLEQYRLQLYNYALSMERLRGPPYTAAAMAAAAAYASTTTVSGSTTQDSNYTTTTQETSAVPPSYLCTSTAGNIFAACSRMGRAPATLTQCPTGNRLSLTSMSLFPQRIFHPEEPKPQHSYIGLIAMAILNSAESKLVLSDIYQYILDNYPYFRTRGPGWRNSIRHNLSLNDCFVKSGRSANGKGHYWAIHPANMEDFRKGDFRRRKAQRKVRKHMGLAVDDNGADSPSPPPAMDLTSLSPPSYQHIVMGSSTITPLTAGAQHSASQSFGWRFTQNHPLSGSLSTNSTAASYMSQIFSYRPQHYANAATSAVAFRQCTNSQQQQQLIPPTSQQQHYMPETSTLPQHNILSAQSSIAATHAQMNDINELFSQKRKRQFDVASLLAPDQSNKYEHQRKHACESEINEVRLTSSCNEIANDVDIEDIDVVDASEDEDIEADYDEMGSNSNSQSGSHSASRSHNDEEEAEYIRTLSTKHALRLRSPNDCIISQENISENETVMRVHNDNVCNSTNVHYEENEQENSNEEIESKECSISNKKSTNQNETYFSSYDINTSHLIKSSTIPLQIQTLQTTQQQITTVKSSPKTPSQLHSPNQLFQQTNEIQHCHTRSHPQLPINAEAHNLFGRYYGTYMAAAAAARINSMQSD